MAQRGNLSHFTGPSPSSSLDTFARAKLAALAADARLRTPTTSRRDDAVGVQRDGRRLISFSSNDYLNLTQQPEVLRAAHAALTEFGTGSGGSPLVSGRHPLYERLEAALADYKGSAAACLFGSGYLANLGVIPSLVGSGDLVLVDQLAHACIVGGARLSGATIATFAHNDATHAATLLARLRTTHRHALLATENVFSMDGDLAPLDELASLAAEYDAWLLTDDAHGLGVLAPHSRPPIALQIGTLSKALASYGGYACASQAVVALLHNRARTFVYSTALPPASVAAALAALTFVREQPDYCARPLENARRFTQRLGLAPAASPIVPLVVGASRAALAASQALEARGFLVVAIRPPTVPEGTARLRVAFSAQHSDEAIDALADAVTDVLG